MVSQAFILAAGLGTRLRPFTLSRPKCLFEIQGQPLIDRHLSRLAQAGFKSVCINLGYLGQQVQDFCGDGSRYGLAITYVHEDPSELYDTGGGVRHALNTVASFSKVENFLLISADIYTDFDWRYYTALPMHDCLANIALIKKPNWIVKSDFQWDCDQQNLLWSDSQKDDGYVFSGFGLFNPQPFLNVHSDGAFGLSVVINQLIRDKQIKAHVCHEIWENVGSMDRVKALDKRLSGGLHI